MKKLLLLLVSMLIAGTTGTIRCENEWEQLGPNAERFVKDIASKSCFECVYSESKEGPAYSIIRLQIETPTSAQNEYGIVGDEGKTIIGGDQSLKSACQKAITDFTTTKFNKFTNDVGWNRTLQDPVKSLFKDIYSEKESLDCYYVNKDGKKEYQYISIAKQPNGDYMVSSGIENINFTTVKENETLETVCHKALAESIAKANRDFFGVAIASNPANCERGMLL